jgi:hypothetical protein
MILKPNFLMGGGGGPGGYPFILLTFDFARQTLYYSIKTLGHQIPRLTIYLSSFFT